MTPPVVVAFVIPGDALVPFPGRPPAFLLGLPVPAAPLPAGLFDPGDPPPTAPAGGPPPTAAAPPPTAALPMPAAPTPAPIAPPRPPPPPANANPTGSAAISSAKAKLLGLQMIMARSFSVDPQIMWGGLLGCTDGHQQKVTALDNFQTSRKRGIDDRVSQKDRGALRGLSGPRAAQQIRSALCRDGRTE